ncbi:MAG: efflux RND transporter periplasmic adaptor subunit, partial [Urechidicola sp.]|nr:efflux RND transporter periplasmic adaptor subunit [Urechidicola sp.]
FKEGSRVKKGDLLYVIDSDPFLEAVAAEQSMVSQAETNLVQKESDLARVQPLAAIDAISQRELDAAVASRDAGVSALDAAHANLNITQINLGYCKIYSPINGVIGRTLAREGEFVGKDPNPVILNTVSNIESIRVQFFLSEIEYLKIAKEYINEDNEDVEEDTGSKVKVHLILADGTDYEPLGKINFVDRNVNSSTGAILVEASFPNAERLLRPGQFARIKIQARTIKDALLVPQKCVSELQGQFSVFIVNSENKVETKQVVIGENVGQYYLVREGLNANDKVILEGLQKVRSGMEVIPEITQFEEAKQMNE